MVRCEVKLQAISYKLQAWSFVVGDGFSSRIYGEDVQVSETCLQLVASSLQLLFQQSFYLV
jgi:hypothetical protein